MMRTGLPSTNPAIAAAEPVREFSRLMTTGMSAPPIGRTMVTPKMRPAITTSASSPSVTPLGIATTPAEPRMRASVPSTATAATPIVTSWPPGR